MITDQLCLVKFFQTVLCSQFSFDVSVWWEGGTVWEEECDEYAETEEIVDTSRWIQDDVVYSLTNVVYLRLDSAK